MKITDEMIVNWLSDCTKIDHSGREGGWVFERLLMTEDPLGTAEVRIATIGFEGIDGLRKQVKIAMEIDRTMASNPWVRAEKKRGKQ